VVQTALASGVRGLKKAAPTVLEVSGSVLLVAAAYYMLLWILVASLVVFGWGLLLEKAFTEGDSE